MSLLIFAAHRPRTAETYNTRKPSRHGHRREHVCFALEELRQCVTRLFFRRWENFELTSTCSITACRFVEDQDECVFYKDAYGQAKRRVVYASVPSDSGVDVDAC